ncbi:MAG: HAD-IIIC family phosphatase [Geminicoccaceae bacterium]
MNAPATNGCDLAIAASFTSEPLVEALSFWAGQLGQPWTINNLPSGQLLPLLLDARSELYRASPRQLLVCARLSDLAPAGGARSIVAEAEAARELIAALKDRPLLAPTLLQLAPEREPSPERARVRAWLTDALANLPGITIVDGSDVLSRYAVADAFDAAGDVLAHMPYSEAAYSALACGVARWLDARLRPPLKLIAVDADNTLWQGVVGEDGPLGLQVTDAHRSLHDALKRQARLGRIVCLLSKNTPADIAAVFAEREDLGLSREDILAEKIDWQRKSDNLRELVEQFAIGLDACLFLDDNPLECAEMRAACPEVATIQVPTDPAKLSAFIEHCWLFDTAGATDEDLQRQGHYRAQAARGALRDATASYAAFIDSLELEVAMAPPERSDITRLAQLSQRTNQFNLSLKRLDEAAIAARLADPSGTLRVVRVRDRFGDYGLVGVLGAHVDDATLEVDLFLLSCRALARGVEHQMAAALGRDALARGLSQVRIAWLAGPRNAPARRFLAELCGGPPSPNTVTLTAAELATLRFEPGRTPTDAASEIKPSEDASARLQPVLNADVYARIADAFTTVDAIHRAATERRRRARPALANPFVAPAEGLQTSIAAVWQDVLQVTPIGAHDRYADLGGTSVQLVRIHSAIQRRLNRNIPFASLFAHGTVAALAAYLALHEQPASETPSQQRAARMRAARERRQAMGALR